MNKTFRKLFLFIAPISLFFTGCATSPNSSYTIADDRVEFPYYGLSITRPPEHFEMTEDLGYGQVVVWLDKASGSSIGIFASKLVMNLSYHDIIISFARSAYNQFLQWSPSAFYEIADEGKVYFNKREFYRADIVYEGLPTDWRLKTEVFVHKIGDFVYCFVFLNEPSDPLARDMMQSVTFSRATGIRQATEIAEPKQVIIHPEALFEFNGFSIQSPNSEGWFILKEKGDAEVLFGKPTPKGLYHTLRARVSTIRNRVFLSTKDLKAFVEADFSHVPSRHRNVNLTTSIVRVHGVECALYDVKMEDHAVPNAPGKIFDMIERGYVCPHPDFPESYVINIEYSQRFLQGEEPLPNNSERDSFLNSLRFNQAASQN
jgi:hypothetical protein